MMYRKVIYAIIWFYKKKHNYLFLLEKFDNLRENNNIIYDDNKMISADVDQIYGIIKLSVSDRGNFRNKFSVAKKELLFPTDTPFVPFNLNKIES